MRLAFIDTETTGLTPSIHDLIEFAVILEEDGVRLDTFRCKIKPLRIDLAEPAALRANKYTPEAWRFAMTLEEAVPIIASLLKGCVLVGHNVSFDEAFLVEALKRAQVPGKIPHRKIDTVTLAYEHLTPLGLKSTALDAVREFLGWSKEDSHTALQDAEDSRNLYHLCCRMSPLSRLRLRASLAWRRWKRSKAPRGGAAPQ